MVKFRSLFRIFFLLILCFVVGFGASSVEAKEKIKKCEAVDFSNFEYTTSIDDAGNEVLTFENPNEVVEEMKLEKPNPDAKVVGVYVVKNAYLEEYSAEPPSEVQPFATVYVEPTREAETCGSTRIGYTSAPGDGGDLTLSINRNVNATYSANVSVSSQIVSAGVGFSVTEGVSITATKTVKDTKRGTFYEIAAYAAYNTVFFDVIEDGLFGDRVIGSGYANQPIGACFVVYES